MIRNTAGQIASGEVINATTGAPFAGTVIVYVTIDGGVQAVGAVGSGVCANEGQGLFTYTPSAAETNGAHIDFTFTGSGAINANTGYDTLTPGQAAAIATSTTPGTSTVQDLITAALRRLRVISGSDPADGDTLTDALLRFNDWIDDLRNEDLLKYARLRTTWALSSATSYTIGSGGTINIDRPISPQDIENCGFIDTALSPTYEYLLGVPLSEDARAGIPMKSLTSVYPQSWYYNPTIPLGLLYPWPIPSSSSLLGVIYTGINMSEMTLVTSLVLPPGYRRMLRDGIAIELAPEFHVSDPAILGPLTASYREAKSHIKSSNARLYDLVQPDACALFGMGRSHYNIITGQ